MSHIWTYWFQQEPYEYSIYVPLLYYLLLFVNIFFSPSRSFAASFDIQLIKLENQQTENCQPDIENLLETWRVGGRVLFATLRSLQIVMLVLAPFLLLFQRIKSVSQGNISFGTLIVPFSTPDWTLIDRDHLETVRKMSQFGAKYKKQSPTTFCHIRVLYLLFRVSILFSLCLFAYYYFAHFALVINCLLYKVIGHDSHYLPPNEDEQQLWHIRLFCSF